MIEGQLAIGVDVGGTTFSVALVASTGDILAEEDQETRAVEGPESILQRITEAVRTVMATAGVSSEDIKGVGLGIPGLHDRERGVTLTSPNLKWQNMPVRQILGDALSTSVQIDGDVRVAAVGERHFGAAGGCDNFIFITLGTGIGSGIFLDGKLYRGPAGYAGEVGHQTIVEDGPLCGCGNYGCVEALAGNAGIVRRARVALQSTAAPLLMREVGNDVNRISPAALHKAALAGCDLSRQVLADTGRYVGTAMANLVNVLNPERLIVGGGVAQAGEMILGPLRATISRRAMGPNAAMLKIVPAALGKQAGVLGAAAMVLFDLD